LTARESDFTLVLFRGRLVIAPTRSITVLRNAVPLDTDVVLWYYISIIFMFVK